MPAPFFILVVNGPRKGVPRFEHPTLEQARTEAERMHAVNGGCYAVRVLESVEELPATAAPPEKPPEPPKPAPVQPKQPAPQAAKTAPAPAKPKAAPVVVVKKKRSAEAPASEA